jgi:molybdate transport system ATP-binding protein
MHCKATRPCRSRRARDASVAVDAVLEDYDTAYGLATLSVDGGPFLIPSPPAAKGEKRRLRIAAGDVSLTLEPTTSSTILNILPVRIVSASALGQNEVLAVLCPRSGSHTVTRILTRVTRRSWEHLGLAASMDLYAQVKSVVLTPRPDQAHIQQD